MPALSRDGIGLVAANAVALMAGAGASLAYARWLEPASFAHWAMALAAGRCALLLLDGGLKTVLVRQPQDPDTQTWRTLERGCAAAALGLTVVLAAALAGLAAAGVIATTAAALLVIYPAAYLLSYPALLPALARLERSGRFGALGRVEGITALVELVLPALLMACGLAWWLSFCVAAVLARSWRTWQTRAVERAIGPLPAQAQAQAQAPVAVPSAGEARRLLRAGLAQQAVFALAMLRDLTHVWLLGPWFGKAWVGQYALAHSASALVCQPLVLGATRMLLPELRTLAPAQRRQRVMQQISGLCMASLPPMLLLPLALASADAWLGAGKWADARALLPWLGLRLVGGVVATVLGTWLCVQAAPWAATRAHARWTLVEIVGALAGLALGGPPGLAMASAVSVWFAAWDFCGVLAAPGQRLGLLREAAACALGRPSLLVAGAGLWLLQRWPQPWPWLPLLPLLAWLAEARVRQALRRLALRLVAGRAGPPLAATLPGQGAHRSAR
ncbi:hypothetical protein [Aquabacterium sp. OR-4]|uniref:hypothetical protein n=1 Tax=Aquabacterium sp. OR-4 TaxID=2978127 RepID=UPI0028C75735|nr:hypothetical protein [Aquabacterium sp. OR-4]MDT7838929.1 hypothetical protein [Aquabacterium sp. OR-4]